MGAFSLSQERNALFLRLLESREEQLPCVVLPRLRGRKNEWSVTPPKYRLMNRILPLMNDLP